MIDQPEGDPVLLQLRAVMRRLLKHMITILAAARDRLSQPPPSWGTLIVACVGLVFAAISATFATLNYFTVPKARAAMMLDRFDPMIMDTTGMPALDKHIFHNMRLWFANTGQASATLRNVTISAEFYDEPLDAATESQRMEYVAKNKQTIGSNLSKLELTPGQKIYFSSHAGFPDPLWSEYEQRKKLLYEFALITFSDESSDGREIVREICVRIDPDLTWLNCVSGHNQTIR